MKSSPGRCFPPARPAQVLSARTISTLKYEDTWDRLRRIGPDSDVVVRFDDSPIRLVFWQGTSYIPAWVTENGTVVYRRIP